MTITKIELTPEESVLLKEVLESDLSELRMEISHTDSFDFREQLKKKQQMLTSLVGRL